jgi:hypothetical protein
MKAAIDRIEEGIAVLIPRENEALPLHLPVSVLPPGCREGDIVTISVERDEAATDAARERVAGLVRRLEKSGR